jgi:hypothetical protein
VEYDFFSIRLDIEGIIDGVSSVEIEEEGKFGALLGEILDRANDTEAKEDEGNVAELRAEIEGLRHRLTELVNEHNVPVESPALEYSSHSDREGSLNSFEEEDEEEEETNDAIREELQRLEEENNVLKTEFDRIVLEYEERVRTEEKLSAEVLQLKERIRNLENESSIVSEVEREAEERILALQQELSEMTRNLEKESSRVSEVEREAEERILALQQEFAKKQADFNVRISEIRNEYERKITELGRKGGSALDAELLLLRNESQERINILENDLAKAAAREEVLNSKILKLQKESEQRIKALEEGHNKQILQIQKEFELKDKVVKTNSTEENENIKHQCEVRIKVLEDENARKCSAFSVKLEQLQAELAETVQENSRIKNDYQVKIANLEEDLREKSKLINTPSSTKQEGVLTMIQMLQDENQVSVNKLATLQAEIVSLKEEGDRLRGIFLEQENLFGQQSKDPDDSSHNLLEASFYQEECLRLEKECQEQRDDLKRLEVALQEKQLISDDLRIENEFLISENSEAKARVLQLEKKREKLKKQNLALVSGNFGKVKDLTDALETLRYRNSELLRLVDISERERRDLEKSQNTEKSELVWENRKLANALKASAHELSRVSIERRSNEELIECLKSEVSGIKDMDMDELDRLKSENLKLKSHLKKLDRLTEALNDANAEIEKHVMNESALRKQIERQKRAISEMENKFNALKPRPAERRSGSVSLGMNSENGKSALRLIGKLWLKQHGRLPR